MKRHAGLTEAVFAVQNRVELEWEIMSAMLIRSIHPHKLVRHLGHAGDRVDGHLIHVPNKSLGMELEGLSHCFGDTANG